LKRVDDWTERPRVHPDMVREPRTMDKLVELTLTPDVAVTEAMRCLSCGCGIGCDRCFSVCLYSAIKTSDGRYEIDPEKCDGCGLCSQICPNSNIEMVLDEKLDD